MCAGDPSKPHWMYCDSRDCCNRYLPVPASGYTVAEAREVDRREEARRHMAGILADARKNLQNTEMADLVPFETYTSVEPHESGPELTVESSTSLMEKDIKHNMSELFKNIGNSIVVPTGTSKWPSLLPKTATADGKATPNFQNAPSTYRVEDDASVRDVIEHLYTHWRAAADKNPGAKTAWANYGKLADTMLEVLTLLDTENIE